MPILENVQICAFSKMSIHLLNVFVKFVYCLLWQFLTFTVEKLSYFAKFFGRQSKNFPFLPSFSVPNGKSCCFCIVFRFQMEKLLTFCIFLLNLSNNATNQHKRDKNNDFVL